MVDVRHFQLKSSVMESVGCERALEFLMKEWSIQELVTNASSKLIKMLVESTVVIDSNIWFVSSVISTADVIVTLIENICRSHPTVRNTMQVPLVFLVRLAPLIRVRQLGNF